jgi:tetratricopeptide (TPR) repeat protein
MHLVFTDHAIRRRPDALANTPPVLAANADFGLVSAWPNAKPDPMELGAAYVLLHETMWPQRPALSLGYQLLAEAVSLNPTDSNSRFWLGSALLALQRPAEARDELRRVLLARPAWHEARFRLGLSEEALGNVNNAIAEYQRLRTECPHWPEPRARLAQLYLAQQRAAEAASVLRQLVSLEPAAASYASLALAEQLSGASREQALATADRAIEIDSRQPAIYVTRGAIWLLSGRTSEARRDFEHALRLDPTNSAARQAINALPGDR